MPSHSTHINPPPPSSYPAQVHFDDIVRKVRWWVTTGLVVNVGVGCLGSCVWLLSGPVNPPIRTTQTQMKSFKGPLQLYHQEQGTFPDDLSTLVAQGYMPELPTDEWGNDFSITWATPDLVRLRSPGEDTALYTDDDIALTLNFSPRRESTTR